MELRSLTTAGTARGVARLVLVVAALVGFLAMHGLDATDAAGTHHAMVVVPAQPLSGHQPMAAESVAAVASPGTEPTQHDAVMAGCVFILLALAGGLALRALFVTVDRNAASGTARRAPGPRPARAPPCPVFVSHCVFRL